VQVPAHRAPEEPIAPGPADPDACSCDLRKRRQGRPRLLLWNDLGGVAAVIAEYRSYGEAGVGRSRAGDPLLASTGRTTGARPRSPERVYLCTCSARPRQRQFVRCTASEHQIVDEQDTCLHEHPGVRTMLLLDIVLLLPASKEAKQ
jgi:hypothetical protein